MSRQKPGRSICNRFRAPSPQVDGSSWRPIRRQVFPTRSLFTPSQLSLPSIEIFAFLSCHCIFVPAFFPFQNLFRTIPPYLPQLYFFLAKYIIILLDPTKLTENTTLIISHKNVPLGASNHSVHSLFLGHSGYISIHKVHIFAQNCVKRFLRAQMVMADVYHLTIQQ